MRACSRTYGGGSAKQRNLVISKAPLPRHHPDYDNFATPPAEIYVPRPVLERVEAHLDEFERQGARSRAHVCC